MMKKLVGSSLYWTVLFSLIASIALSASAGYTVALVPGDSSAGTQVQTKVPILAPCVCPCTLILTIPHEWQDFSWDCWVNPFQPNYWKNIMTEKVYRQDSDHTLYYVVCTNVAPGPCVDWVKNQPSCGTGTCTAP